MRNYFGHTQLRRRYTYRLILMALLMNNDNFTWKNINLQIPNNEYRPQNLLLVSLFHFIKYVCMAYLHLFFDFGIFVLYRHHLSYESHNYSHIFSTDGELINMYIWIFGCFVDVFVTNTYDVSVVYIK